MRRIPIFLSLLMLAVPVSGWTPRTEVEISRTALDLGPPDLRRLVRIYDESFRDGLRDAARDEVGKGRTDHFALSGDQLAERIFAETNAAIAIVKEREPLTLFVYRLGLIAHLIGDANNPFLTSPSPGLYDYRADYEAYLERRLPRIPAVFYGIDRPMTPAYTISSAIERSRGLGPALLNEYERGERVRSSSEFDDRSTAFGIASLSWSHAMSDLTNIFYYIWEQSGGDIRRASQLEKGVIDGGAR